METATALQHEPATRSQAHTADDTLAARLRGETRAEHAAIEQVACMRRLFAPDYEWHEYLQLLQRTAPVVVALEQAIAPRLPDPLKDRLVRQQRLALDLGPDWPSAWAERAAVPVFDTPDAALGALYVLEGSTLGGQLICRQLLARLGDPVRERMHYFAGHGEENGRRWREFLAFLASGSWHAPRVIAAARQTFSTLTQALR